MYKPTRNKRHKIATLSLVSAITLLCSLEASALAITAEANWAGLPHPITPTQNSDVQNPLVNGDFTIQNGNNILVGERGYIIGDGINEGTDWTFNFSTDPSWGAFDFSAPLQSAELVLTLIPRGLQDPNSSDPNAQLNDFCSDGVFIHGISGGVRIIPGGGSGPCAPFQFDVGTTVTVDMLSYQNNGVPVPNISDRIMQKLQEGAGGQLSMRYIADAIIEKAELTLVNSVPEPGTWLLISLGFAGMGTKRYQGT